MNDRVFIDTNILLYARDGGQPAKQLVAHAWMAALWRTRQGRLSFHVLQEFYVNATQKLKPGLPILLARQDVRSLLAWRPVKNDAALIESAWMLADRYGFSWWDAQIVAAARRADCRILLTEDMQHRLQVDGFCCSIPLRQMHRCRIKLETASGPRPSPGRRRYLFFSLMRSIAACAEVPDRLGLGRNNNQRVVFSRDI